MNQALIKLGVFSAKALVVSACVIAVSVIGFSGSGNSASGDVSVVNLSKNYIDTKIELSDKIDRKISRSIDLDKSYSLFVIDFKAGAGAEAVESFSKEVSALLSIANKGDHALIKIDTGGGVVNGYGLGMSQMERLKKAGIVVNVSVDKVAASGGYLMASVADNIIAAPFAYVGSIGVVAGIPNFHEAMEKIGVSYETYTIGESKRTVSMFNKNSEEDVARLNEQLIRIYNAFKDNIAQHRSNVDVDKVSTGDFWLAKDAIKLGLVDSLGTSDEFIEGKINSGVSVYQIIYHKESGLFDKIGSMFLQAKMMNTLMETKFY